MTEPAPTLTGKAGGQWVLRVGAQAHATERTTDAPALLASADNGDTRWVYERPATTIVGSFRPDVVAAPGYRVAGSCSRQDAEGSVKITEQEALILQSARADYPVQGSRSKRFEQIGNMVPPRMGAFLLAAVIGLDPPDFD